MSKADRKFSIDTVLQFMNNTYSTPNSVNEKRIRKNCLMNKELSDYGRTLFKDNAWVDWFAKIDTDIKSRIPKALEDNNRDTIKIMLKFYNGSPRIQAQIIAIVHKLLRVQCTPHVISTCR